MTNCTRTTLGFPALKRRKIEANFAGGDVSSNGGVLLLREINRRLGLLKAVDQVLPDPRDPRYTDHIVGLAKNNGLLKAIADVQVSTAETYEHQQPVRLFKELRYAAGTWSRSRKNYLT